MTPHPYSIETLSGQMFDFAAPTVASVDLGDIATALSNTCRFAGHVKRFYSVAEHACLVYGLVKEAGFPPDVCYAALHHDSHEAYLGDVPTPLKALIKETAPQVWERLEWRINLVISSALGIDQSLLAHDAVKAADTQALGYEAVMLKPSGRAQRDGAWVLPDPSEVPDWAVQGWNAELAANTFLYYHQTAREELGR